MLDAVTNPFMPLAGYDGVDSQGRPVNARGIFFDVFKEFSVLFNFTFNLRVSPDGTFGDRVDYNEANVCWTRKFSLRIVKSYFHLPRALGLSGIYIKTPLLSFSQLKN